jgi:hypothetical protein
MPLPSKILPATFTENFVDCMDAIEAIAVLDSMGVDRTDRTAILGALGADASEAWLRVCMAGYVLEEKDACGGTEAGDILFDLDRFGLVEVDDNYVCREDTDPR